MNRYLCPVCGYPMEDPPFRYNVCASCGTEFDHSVSLRYEHLRREWIRSGARWWSKTDEPPIDWNPFVQLARAGFQVRFPPGSEANGTLRLGQTLFVRLNTTTPRVA